MADQERETVECLMGPCCGLSEHNLASAFPYGPDHHGWDCPLADPLGDALRLLMDPHPNPILEEQRQRLIRKWSP